MNTEESMNFSGKISVDPVPSSDSLKGLEMPSMLRTNSIANWPLPTVDEACGEAKRECKDCGCALDETYSEFSKRCKECFTAARHVWESTPKRPCKLCDELEIALDAPIWKTVCSTCFYDRAKLCVDCNKNISPDKPKYQTRCHQCYITRRKKTHTTCPKCPPAKSQYLTMRKGKTACDTCAKSAISK